MKRLHVLLLALVLAAGCCTSRERAWRQPAMHPGRVQHVVVMWLKEPGNAQHRRQLLDASYDLAAIPGVESVAAGQPLPSTRPVVDSSYDLAVTFVLRDAAALAAYQAHPLHQAAAEQTMKPLVARILVYDFVE